MTTRTVHLYGDLANRFGDAHEVAVTTLSEALRVIECNCPGFLAAVRRLKFHVAHGSPELEQATEVQEHQLFVPRSRGDWHLIPVLSGGKSNTGKAIFSIVVGGALLATGIGGAAAFANIGTSGWSLGFAASSGVLGASYGTLALLGAGAVLGGISQLLTPTPKGDTASKTPTSFTFGGPDEVDDEGGPIPIVIGEVICGGTKIASAITSTGGFSLSQSNQAKDTLNKYSAALRS